MTNKELITAGCVVGGLVGLGILAYMMLREDEEKVERALNDPDLSEGYRKRQQASFQVDPTDSLDEEDMVEEEPDPHMGIELTPLEELDEAPGEEPMEVAKEVDIEPTKASVQTTDGAEFPLRLGSKGHRVERLQVFLTRNYGVFGQVTDTFDKRTEDKVKKHLGVDSVSEKTYKRYRMGKHVTEQVIIR